MNEQDADREEESPSEGEDFDIVGFLMRMKQQLDFLEKKIDTLLSRSGTRAFEEKKPYSKPFSNFQREPRRGEHHRGEHHRGAGRHERSEFGPGRHSEESGEGRKFGRGGQEGGGAFARYKKPSGAGHTGFAKKTYGPKRHAH